MSSEYLEPRGCSLSWDGESASMAGKTSEPEKGEKLIMANGTATHQLFHIKDTWPNEKIVMFSEMLKYLWMQQGKANPTTDYVG